MKKVTIASLLAGFIITGLLLFSACSNILSPSAGAAGTGQGNVRVALSAGPSGRTLMPSALDFDGYDFAFSNTTYNHTFSVTKDGPFTFNVPVGSGYSLNVTAYKGTGDSRVIAASGGSTEPFTIGATTSVTVKLTGNSSGGANGTFSYSITYPSGAGIVRFVLTGSGEPVDLLNGAVAAADGNGIKNEVDVPAGWYGLELDLADGAGKVAYDDDIVVIYSNTTTFYGKDDKAVVFEAGDFKAPDTPPSENVGEQVSDWHGFYVNGPSDYASGALGTQYDTFTDKWGTYTDVLKLEPPSGHYEETASGDMALSYTVPSDGYYKLSMSIMVEEWPVKGVDIFWQQVNGIWATIAGGGGKIQGVQAGEWFVISTADPLGVHLNAGDTFALLTKQNNNTANGNSYDNGLNDAVIYIRNLRLELNDSPLVDTSAADGHVYGVTLSPASLDMSIGDECNLTVQVFPSGAVNQNVIWSSGDTNVATVDQSGVVTAVGLGSALVTVTTEEGSFTARSLVTVHEEGYVEPKYIALTFDDGPDPSATPRLLKILADWNVHATFFLIGNNAQANPDVVRAILAGGHDIGNHSLTHAGEYYDVSNGAYHPQSQALYKQELIATQDIIKSITGIVPTFFRSPHLCQEGNLLTAAGSVQLPNMFAKLFNDWVEGTPPEQIYWNTLGQDDPWAIFDFHDCGANPENTVDAIPMVLDNLINTQGYKVVSLSEMMNIRKALYLSPGAFCYNDFTNVSADPAFPIDGKIVKAESISIADTVINLNAGDTYTLNATVQPAETTRKKVLWYSENDNVASVSSAGLVTANFGGTTTIRAVADGRMAVVTVNVNGPSAVDSWTVFNYGGGDFASSGAVGQIGSWEGYSNVLRLALPAGVTPVSGTVAMSYALPAGGNCSLSMDVWVEKRNYQDIQVYWEENATNQWHCVAENTDPLTEGTWIHVETPNPDTCNLPADDIMYLLILNSPGTGLKDAVLYIRDLKLEIDGQAVLNIPGGVFDPATAFEPTVSSDPDPGAG